MTFKDRFYRNYSSTHVTHRKGEATLERFRAEFATWDKHFGPLLPTTKEARILDAGCGRGGLVHWLNVRGYRQVEGIDVSAEQVETAHALGLTNIRQADLNTYLLSRHRSYDVLILRDVIEHFAREQIIEILELCRAATRPGGILIIQVPNAESPFFGRIRYGDFTHELAFSNSSVIQLFNVIGLEDPRIYPTEPAVSGLRSLLRYVLWIAVKGFYHLLVFAELGRGDHIFTQGLIATGRAPAEPA